jgi:tRNA G26 N,N-dimethylase Trm1
MAMPQNTEQKRQKTRPRHEKTEEFYCSRCATEHGQRQCPAFDKKCRRCGTYGHFWVCPKRSTENKQPRMNTEDDDEQDEEEHLLHCFEFADDEDDWFEEVKIAG